MITEDYVSFETAKLLKEKGFDGKCDYLYIDGIFVRAQGYKCNWNKGETIFTDYKNECSAPTLQMAMKWLRDIHNIIIEPESFWNGKKWEYLLFVVTPQNADSPYYEHNPYKSYEECVESAIKYCLKHLI